jgi:hypothetical protein
MPPEPTRPPLPVVPPSVVTPPAPVANPPLPNPSPAAPPRLASGYLFALPDDESEPQPLTALLLANNVAMTALRQTYLEVLDVLI